MKFKDRLLKIISILISFSFTLGSSFTVHAIGEQQFKNITIKEGLSQGTVETIFQDSKGYIWFGTNDGLNRYNGYEFKEYYKNSEHNIVNNYIIDIEEDNEGNIWIGTIDGVSKISKNDTIENYTSNKESGNLSNSNVCEILVLNYNSILVATTDGLNYYDAINNKFIRILQDKLTNEFIYSLDQDKENNIWIGTNYGLNKLNLNNNSITQYYSDNTNNTIASNEIYKVFCDKNNIVWIGTTDNGFSKFDEKNNVFINNYNKLYDKNSLAHSNTFTAMEDKMGLIWIGTYSGVSVFDPNSNIKVIRHDPFKLQGTINDNMIHGLYEDINNNIWVVQAIMD